MSRQTGFAARWACAAVSGIFLLIGCVATGVARAEPQREQAPIAITDVSIIDVEHGRAIGPRTVLVEGGRIVAIETPADAHIPAVAERLDGRGKFLIPGLVDMHVHLFNNVSHRAPNTWAFPLFVANGVTAVREMAAIPASIAIVREWRDASAKGALLAPRVIAAGVVAYGPTPDEAAQQVDAAAEAGADFIKVFSELSEPSWHAVLDEARKRALPVMGHVPAGVSALASAAAGQRSAEHLMQVFEACSTIESTTLQGRRGLAGEALVARRDADEMRVLDAYDRRTCDRVASALASSPQVQVPTLVLPYTEHKGVPSPASDPRWKYLRSDEQARWLRAAESSTPEERAVAPHRWPVARRIASALHRAHVTMLAGTDTPMPGVYPGFSLHEELARLVDAGLTPAEALRDATLAPAAFLGIANDTGSVAVGKRADLVLLDRDPLRDIGNTRRIDSVVLGGRLLRRSALDASLAEAAASVARKD